VVADQDKLLRFEDRAQTQGLRALGSLVNDAIVELEFVEQWIGTAVQSRKNYLLLLDLARELFQSLIGKRTENHGGQSG